MFAFEKQSLTGDLVKKLYIHIPRGNIQNIIYFTQQVLQNIMYSNFLHSLTHLKHPFNLRYMFTDSHILIFTLHHHHWCQFQSFNLTDHLNAGSSWHSTTELSAIFTTGSKIQRWVISRYPIRAEDRMNFSLWKETYLPNS